MKQSNKCPKCQSSDILADVYVKDRGPNGGWELTVSTFRRPDALLFKGEQTTSLRAWICVGCGYVELYAQIPQVLKIKEPTA